VDVPSGTDFVVGPTRDGFDVAVVDAAPPELSFR